MVNIWFTYGQPLFEKKNNKIKKCMFRTEAGAPD